MKTEEVNIRDPYILLHEGVYYLYGTRSATCWGEADGFDCYKSRDCENWEGPIEIFHRPEGYFADRNYWAPECVEKDGKFYLITTLASADRKKGIYVLISDNPDGPFVPYSECLTPPEWSCIDGTVYIEDGHPYRIFSHSFEDSPTGDMCVMTLADDLKTSISAPQCLFSACEAEWAKPVPFAKEEFGMDGDVYFTDGPCVFEMNGRLYMTWSSWGTCGYAVGTAVSETGKVIGPWKQLPDPVYPENGGHGMVFADQDGSYKFLLHYPNDKYKERPRFTTLLESDSKLQLV